MKHSLKQAVDTTVIAQIDAASVPKHIAIIMDGNGRWAKARGLPRTFGHKKGAEALGDLLKSVGEMGVEYLTVYAFSAENWKRPAIEISELMGLLKYYLHHELKRIHEQNIRLKIIGDRTDLDKEICHQIEDAEILTAGNTGLTLLIALSYGSRQELLRAVRTLAARVEKGEFFANAITEEMLISVLDTQKIPDPDLLIRTGGEQRLSNFLLWQSAYTELWFTPVLWPDFTNDTLKEAIHDYATRERRFGTANE